MTGAQFRARAELRNEQWRVTQRDVRRPLENSGFFCIYFDDVVNVNKPDLAHKLHISVISNNGENPRDRELKRKRKDGGAQHTLINS